MKMRIASLSLLTICCLMLAVAPAMADSTLYSNGPVNGNSDGWTINIGFSVSNSATVSCPGFPTCNINSLSVAYWLIPGDSRPGVDISLGTTSFGSDLPPQPGIQESIGETFLFTNGFGYSIVVDNYSFASVDVANGSTVWLTLANATVASGDPVYWDENSGPSQAYENSIGSIPSESFTLDGHGVNPGTTPEPSSIMLFGSGILGLAGVLRRKLTR